MNIMHSSRSDLWYTPIDILVRTRFVFDGPPDLDPASDEFGNARVQARYFFTRETNGLTSPWPQSRSVFLNPPGGKTGKHSNTVAFWIKLMEEVRAGNVGHAIFLAFSAEARQTTQGKGVPSINEFPSCTPARRIAFDRADGARGAAPSHSNCIVYVPGYFDCTNLFIHAFSSLGATR